MSAVNGFVEQLHPQIAPPVPSFNVHLIPPEQDEFGLPIRHFARDLDRLRRQVKETTGVVLVTLDFFSDYVCCDDVERAIKDLHPAIEALNQFAIENEVAVVLPSKLAIRARTAASRAANAFRIIPEIATVIVAGSQNWRRSSSQLAKASENLVIGSKIEIFCRYGSRTNSPTMQ